MHVRIARDEYRFLVWRGAGGVGEQLLSLCSAFALALLTDRVLIAHGTLTDEFVAPFYYGWMVRALVDARARAR